MNRIVRFTSTTFLCASLLGAGCADLPAPGPLPARAAPAAEIEQVVPGVVSAAPGLRVIKRSYGGGYFMFELNQPLDRERLDVQRTRLMTVRPDEKFQLHNVEAAGDVFLDASGRVLGIQVADQPTAGDVYRASTFAAAARAGAPLEEIDLGDIVIRGASAAPISDPQTFNLPVTLFKLPGGINAPIGGVFAPPTTPPPPPPTLTLLSSTPDDGALDVPRDLIEVTLKYGGNKIDCANPVTGPQGFYLYSVDPALNSQQQQVMYPEMPVGYGPTPHLVCDAARNQISMELPGLLLGGSTFKMVTEARAIDGTILAATTTFRTQNPGLAVTMVKAHNEIYQCDPKFPFTDSFKCDIYLVIQAKTRASATEAWQVNSKVPSSGDWSNWSEDTDQVPTPSDSVLYQDATAIGDPFALDVQAYDSDTGDGAKKALDFLGGLGKVVSPFWPPAGAIGLGLTTISSALPTDGDDFEGGGTFYLPKSARWGTVAGIQTFKLPGRPVDSQIVIQFFTSEYPASWYAPGIIG